MKAMVIERYGPPDVLQLREIPTPSPGEGQVLLRIRAASVNAADWHIMRANPFFARFAVGLLQPKFGVLGTDVAGSVEAVGAAVTRFAPGDEAFGNLFACGMGGFAEYAAVSEDALLPKPASSSFEQAAATPLAAVTALQALRTVGKVEPGQAVLINGASGGVGTFAVQIAKALGAGVTAVASSRNLDQARALGADRVIDYTRENFAELRERYDVIIAISGYHPLSVYGRALKPGGRYVMVGGTGRQWVEAVLLGPLRSRGDKTFARVNAAPALSGPAAERKMRTNLKDLAYVAELLENGRVVPVIDRRYSLSQVPEAICYMEAGHATGKIVITI